MNKKICFECKKVISINAIRCGSCAQKRRLKNSKNHPMLGRCHTEETKLKLSEKSKNVKKIKCEHCNKMFTPWGLSNHTKALNKRKNKL